MDGGKSSDTRRRVVEPVEGVADAVCSLAG